ncbi:MAG: SprT-like domain-containing protein [Dokdonella sp.]|uniref:SprT-like domain-containing protein n=1 Tax=Dokdonella sp. TaxID=2291710 RepID=UPI003F80298C
MGNHVTRDFYGRLQTIAAAFNRSLFDGELPSALFTLTRGVGPLGHFSAERWRATSGETVGEIRLNPMLFGECSWLQLLQTIAHQQCHLWQLTRGTPSRPGYHNAEWANKMQSIGLVPTSTGKPGGRTTGQRMDDFPDPDGHFIKACVALLDRDDAFPIGARWPEGHDPRPLVPPPVKLKLPRRIESRLFSRVAGWAERRSEDGPDIASAKRKVKYACPTCRTRVWGRLGLRVLCQACRRPLECVPPIGDVARAPTG